MHSGFGQIAIEAIATLLIICIIIYGKRSRAGWTSIIILLACGMRLGWLLERVVLHLQ